MNLSYSRIAFLFVLFVVACPCVHGQVESNKQPRPITYWPNGIPYDGSITTPKEFLGFEIGQRHLNHAQLVGYLTTLSEQSDRINFEQYGMTYGGRPLLLLTISSLNNLGQIDAIRNQHRRLADPTRSANVELSDLPAVINMGYGVHGDEASATNCAAAVAYYLAAARGEEIDSLLNNCVILLDPSLNPDGFNRFANWVNGFRGRILNDDPQHREHNQSWPSGRVNYYWFDLNRDWLPLEHPESRARMRWYHAWKPNVVLDFHEMGTNTTYFFQPGVANRTNPFTPAKNIELTAKFGEYHGKALDRKGSYYFTQERFDDFYMGKGSTYPDLHGAVGILFEQASARGHVQKNQDGRLTFNNAIANHFTTSLSSLRATRDLRMELLNYKRDFFTDSVAAAERLNKSVFLFSSHGNQSRLQKFADVLIRHDIDCYWPREHVVVEGKQLTPQHSLIVAVAQAEYRFLKSLLMRRKNFKENIFYDVSSWTLPLAYGISQSNLKSKLDVKDFEKAVLGAVHRTTFRPDRQANSYLIDGRDDLSYELLFRLLNKNINVKVATRPFTAQISTDGDVKSFDNGTLVIQIGIQKQRRRVIENLLAQGARRGVRIDVAHSGLSPSGVDLGSDRFRKIKKPAIAMPVGPGIRQYEAGEIWHLLDQKIGMPLSLLNVDRFTEYDLREYSTFIFPTGRYENWSEQDWEVIAAEIKYGGTAIVVGASCERIKKKLKGEPYDVEAEKENDQSPETQLAFDSSSKTKALQLISGAIFKTRIDRSHPLFFGFPSESLSVFRNHGKFLQPSSNPYNNPAIYDREKPHLAGYCSDENVERFKQSASVVVVPLGKGQIIQISDNPNYRAFWHGTSRLFLNAIFFGDFVDP